MNVIMVLYQLREGLVVHGNKNPDFYSFMQGKQFCQYWLFRLGIAQFYCQQKYNIKENCAQNNKTEQDVDVQLKVTLAGDVYYVA